jgi:hypothetical protein
MCIAIKSLAPQIGYSVLACLALSVISTSVAHADGAFIQQVTGSYGHHGNVVFPITPNTAPTNGGSSWTPHTGSTHGLPELAIPASGNNFASTLEVGSYNKVFQAQAGAGNISNVGIIRGYANNVGVLQAGNKLRSDIALVNTFGLNVGVIQPPGSAPVNMLIARLPNGALLIKR